MKNIVLTGFMATGKTTVGTLLAKKLGRRFIDTDTLIAEHEQKTIPEIFSQNGEKYFRKIESEIIAEVSKLSNCVISTGGGAVLNKKNIDNLRKNGVIVNLAASAKVIAQRTNQNNERPLLEEKTEADIEKMLLARAPYYLDNDFSIDVDNLSPIIITEQIISMYKRLI